MLRFPNSPFPGMNPYLEEPRLWRGFHNSLANEIVAHLIPQLGNSYAAQLEVDTTVETIAIAEAPYIRPDIALVHLPSPQPAEGLVTPTISSPPTERRRVLVKSPSNLRRIIITRIDSDELVTVIELLSPTNKRAAGLMDYRHKRHTLLMADVHLVEIDLLRAGQRPGPEITSDEPYEYVMVVNRASSERISEIWRVAINEPLPMLPIPLLYPDSDVILDFKQLVSTVYTRYGYDRLIDYSQPIPKPPLRPEISAWWEQQVAVLTNLR